MMEPNEMGTTGLIQFVLADGTTRRQVLGRFRRAVNVIKARYGNSPRAVDACRAFTRALIAAEPNRAWQQTFARWGKI